CQSVRPLKPAWSFDLHFPILASVRTGDRHPPVSWLVVECVLDAGDNFLAQLRISKVLKFDRDSHRAILSKRPGARLLVQTGQHPRCNTSSSVFHLAKQRNPGFTAETPCRSNVCLGLRLCGSCSCGLSACGGRSFTH